MNESSLMVLDLSFSSFSLLDRNRLLVSLRLTLRIENLPVLGLSPDLSFEKSMEVYLVV